MSRLVSSLMLLSLMVMVVAYDPTICPWGGMTYVPKLGRCAYLKREASDTPMAHKTKRGEFMA